MKESDILQRVCGSNESLRNEVESLIAAHEKAGSFASSVVYRAAKSWFTDAARNPGDRIQHYEILSTLGHGGMGEVYRQVVRR